MAAQRGKDILLKMARDDGSYETCAGLRTKRVAFNAETVDVTDADASGRWRQLLAGSGAFMRARCPVASRPNAGQRPPARPAAF